MTPITTETESPFTLEYKRDRRNGKDEVTVTQDGEERGSYGYAGWFELIVDGRDPVPEEWRKKAEEMWRVEKAGESTWSIQIKTEAQAAEFWKRLDEKSRLLLAKGAPNVLFHWERFEDTGSVTWMRSLRWPEHGPGPNEVSAHWSKFDRSNEPCEAWVFGEPLGDFATVDDAKAACDAKLRELGFVLEDGE